jgi:hypothetical protein
VPREPQEQARRGYAARELTKAQRNVKTSVILRRRPWGEAELKFQQSLWRRRQYLEIWPSFRRIILPRLSVQFGSYGAPRSALRCAPTLRPTPAKSAVAASGLAELLANLETSSYSESSPLASLPNEWQWHPFELASGKIPYAIGEAVLVDEPPAG